MSMVQDNSLVIVPNIKQITEKHSFTKITLLLIPRL